MENKFFKRSIEFERDREAFCKAYDKLHADYVAVLKHNAYLRNELRESKAKALKEFTEKLKNRLCEECSGCYIPNCFETPTNEFAYNAKEVEKIMDELLKEMKK